jgi:hypothetical protein
MDPVIVSAATCVHRECKNNADREGNGGIRSGRYEAARPVELRVANLLKIGNPGTNVYTQ